MLQMIRCGIVALLTMAALVIPEAPAQTVSAREQFRSAVERAEAFRKQVQLPQAAREYEQALDLARQHLGPEDITTAAVMNTLAELYYAMGRYGEAEPLFRRSLEIREKKLGRDHLLVAQSLNNLANLYRDMGRYGEAEPLHRRSLGILEKHLGRDHTDVATSLNNLATLYHAMGRYGEAEPLFRRSLEVSEKQLAHDHPLVAASLNNLASLYHAMGRYGEAEPLFRRSLEIREKKLGRDHFLVAQSLNNLANLYRDMGRYGEAEPLLRRSLELSEKHLGRDHTDVATSLNNLAALCRDMGRYGEAEPLFRRSLEIQEKQLGRDHPLVAASLNNLAVLYRAMGRYAAAEPLHKRSLEIKEKQLGRDHTDVATSLHELALLYLTMGRYGEAEPLIRRSLEIYEKRLGRDHPHVATGLNNLALLYLAMGRYVEAEPLYKRSLAIGEKQLGRDHPHVATSLSDLALLSAARRHWAEAAESMDRARRVVRRHVARVLPALAENEQLAFLKAKDERQLHGALALALARRDDPDAVGRSAGWVLNGKAVAQEALAQRALLARDRDDPAAARLAAVRQQLAALTLASPQPGQEQERFRAIDRLTAQERELSKQLGQNASRPARDDPWVAPQEVRSALPADAVLVEFARFRVFDFQAKGTEKRWNPPRYAAWVIPPAGRGEVRLIDLGAAEPIEADVAAVRHAIQPDLAALRERGEPAIEAALRPSLEALADRVLRPLLPHIGEAKRWVLSPDAALWLVPWAALPLGKDRCAIEDHQIHYAVSGRDLAQAAATPVAGQALVMADPDFDLDPAAVQQAAHQVLRGRAAPPTELALRGLSRSFRLGSVARLAGTATEAKAIEPKLGSYAGVAPIVYTDRWALEAVFKAFQRPRVVVLSTHGFFLEDQHEEPGSDAGLLETRGTGPRPVLQSENPLLRCGLLLAGCNRPPSGAGEDGVLTGLEVVGTDLRGTELVVLSACETGLGAVSNGEGVAGLRQAFQLAGAGAVVATLWQVPDQESARLMAAFFDELAAGRGKAEALRRAQLAQIESRRRRYGAAHPFFWAAYTLTGQGW
jgi:tetratricopeptide (TPR) repeat protein/CHAT domain-containing protein